MNIHKGKRVSGKWVQVCNKKVSDYGENLTYFWGKVTCKICLKEKK